MCSSAASSILNVIERRALRCCNAHWVRSAQLGPGAEDQVFAERAPSSPSRPPQKLRDPIHMARGLCMNHGDSMFPGSLHSAEVVVQRFSQGES